MNSKSKGEQSEGIILAHLLKKGYSVSLPFGNNQRYDLIVDDGEKLYKAQCKTGHYVNGCVGFWTSSKNGFTGVRSAYHGQIDIFLVYSPHTDKVYRVPIEESTETNLRLRVEPNRGGATSGIRWAKDYEF